MPSLSNSPRRLTKICFCLAPAGLALSTSFAAATAFPPTPTATPSPLMQRCHRTVRYFRCSGSSRQTRQPYRSLQGAFSFPKAGRAIFPKRISSLISFGVPVAYNTLSHRRHIDVTRIFQSLGFSGTNEEDNTPPTAEEGAGDPLKWEKMYYAPLQQRPLSEAQSGVSAQPSTPILDMDMLASTKSEIRVVTFDLDNTIWKTMSTISDANNVLANHLAEMFGIEERSEKRMGQLFKQFPNRYAGVDFSESDNGGGESLQDSKYADIVQNVGQSEIKFPVEPANNGGDGVHIEASFGKKEGGQAKKKPVYLTLLRKDAIRSLMLETEGATSLTASAIELEQQVDSAFEVWVEARCQSISNNFAPSAVPTLMNLRSQLAPDMPHKVYIGAITDGNSNPNRVPELAGVFDFVIRAEDVGASKPDKRVYKAAVAALMLRLGQDGTSVEEFFLGENLEKGIATDTYIAPDSTSTTTTWKDIEEEAVQAFSEAVGPWWVHVGDDFFKDVVAAKECQMRTVWTRELIKGSGSSNDEKDKSMKGGNESEQNPRSVTNLVNEISKSDGVLKMSIGESEFLSQSLHDEFSDAILDQFGELSDLLSRWHNEGKAAQSNNDDASLAKNDNDSMGINSGLSELDVNRPAEALGRNQQPVMDLSDGKEKQKFCVFCGGKLPVVAKFCSHCGERQI